MLRREAGALRLMACEDSPWWVNSHRITIARMWATPACRRPALLYGDQDVDPVVRVLVGIVRELRRSAVREYAVGSLSLPGLQGVQRPVVHALVTEQSRGSRITRRRPIRRHVGGVGRDRDGCREVHGLPAGRGFAGEGSLRQQLSG